MESEEARVSSCRNDAASRILDVDDTITCDSEGTDGSLLNSFSSHRLHGKSPEF
jgi:hypothetical protein